MSEYERLARVWLLTERRHDGTTRTEGVALTNDAASEWVHSPNLEPGQARTSTPVPVIRTHRERQDGKRDA